MKTVKLSLPLIVATVCLLSLRAFSQQTGDLQLVTNPPPFGTFYVASATIPYPFDPYFGKLPIYEWSPGIFIVDDSQATLAANSDLGEFTSTAPLPNPGGGGTGDTNIYPCVAITNFSLSYQYSTNLWLEAHVTTNQVGNLILHTSSTNSSYDLFGTTNMAPLALPMVLREQCFDRPMTLNIGINNDFAHEQPAAPMPLLRVSSAHGGGRI